MNVTYPSNAKETVNTLSGIELRIYNNLKARISPVNSMVALNGVEGQAGLKVLDDLVHRGVIDAPFVNLAPPSKTPVWVNMYVLNLRERMNDKLKEVK